MGLLRWLSRAFGEGPRRRGPSRSGQDKLAAMDAQYLRWLKRHNPQRWAEKMEQRQAGYQPANPLREFIEMRKELAAAGLIPKGEAGDTLDRLVDKLPEVAAAIAPAMSSLAAGRAGPATPRLGPARTPRRRPAEDAPTDPEPEADSPERDSAADEGDEEDEVTLQVPPKVVIATVKFNLQKKTPAQAAAWIRAQAKTYREAADIITLARESTDDQVLPFLRRYATEAPAFAPLMDWLIRRGDWTVQLARELRHDPPARTLKGL